MQIGDRQLTAAPDRIAVMFKNDRVSHRQMSRHFAKSSLKQIGVTTVGLRASRTLPQSARNQD